MKKRTAEQRLRCKLQKLRKSKVIRSPYANRLKGKSVCEDRVMRMGAEAWEVVFAGGSTMEVYHAIWKRFPEATRVEMYRKPIGEAAADEHYGPMVREFYAKAATTARTSDGIHKCADCGRPWSDDVAPVSVAIVDFLGASKQFMAMIMGLCAECDQENDTPEKLVSLLKRDDVLKPEAKVEIRDVSAPAHS
jgi:hypothetical protein